VRNVKRLVPVRGICKFTSNTCFLQSDAAKKKKTDEPTEDVVPEEDKVLCCKRNPESAHAQCI